MLILCVFFPCLFLCLCYVDVPVSCVLCASSCVPVLDLLFLCGWFRARVSVYAFLCFVCLLQ